MPGPSEKEMRIREAHAYNGVMRQTVEGVKLKGGPRDGKTFRPGTKWPMYLHGNGTAMLAAMGDRVLAGRSKTKGCYVVQKVGSTVVHYQWREARS